MKTWKLLVFGGMTAALALNSDAAFNGARIRDLTKSLEAFAKSKCDSKNTGDVNEALGLLNGSLLEIKDENIRAAHANQLRDALSGVRTPLIQALLGPADPDCPKKIRDGIKMLNALPIAGADSQEKNANEAQYKAAD
jgi:hypothetical protein